MSEGQAKRPGLVEAFRDPRWLLMIGLGFFCGLPNSLSGTTLKAWLTDANVDLATIGYFSYVRLPFNLKFLWAPFVDRFRLPFLGRRRGWIAFFQVALFVAIGALGSADPEHAPGMIAAYALAVAFFTASQDIVADAYRTEFLPLEDRADGTAFWISAYRVGLIVSGSGALILSDHVPWTTVYWIMAPLMLLGVVITARAPEVPAPPQPDLEARLAFLSRVPVALRPVARALSPMYLVVLEPLFSFLKRPQALIFLLIIPLYRIGEVVVGEYRITFLRREMGFSATEVGIYDKGFGLGFTIVGALLLVAVGFVKRWGLKRAMIGFGILQAITNLLYALLAVSGKSYPVLFLAISVDNLTNGMGTAVFTAFLMTLCEKRFAAFQFALFSSLMTVPGLLVSGASGAWIEGVGWPTFFLGTVAISLPALFLLGLVQIEAPDR